MKRLSAVLALLFLGACSAKDNGSSQEAMKKTFISRAGGLTLYWMDYRTVPTGALTSSPFRMNESEEINDPFTPQITYWIESMISENAALYAYRQPYPDSTSQTLYMVFFWGYSNSGKRAFGLGYPKNTYDSLKPPTVLTTSSTAEEIAAWKAYHRALQSRDNYVSSGGVVLAREP